MFHLSKSFCNYYVVGFTWTVLKSLDKYWSCLCSSFLENLMAVMAITALQNITSSQGPPDALWWMWAEIVSLFLFTSSVLCRFQLLAFAEVAFNLYLDTKSFYIFKLGEGFQCFRLAEKLSFNEDHYTSLQTLPCSLSSLPSQCICNETKIQPK